MITQVNCAGARRLFNLFILSIMAGWVSLAQAEAVPEPLLIPVGVPETVGLPDHVVVKQLVRVNQRALRSPAISIELPDGMIVIADRASEFIDTLPGYRSWVGDVREAEGSVTVTARGAHFTATFDIDGQVFEVSRQVDGPGAIFELQEIELGQLPLEDIGGVPDGGGSSAMDSATAETAAENVIQDLLVVYNQNACNRVGGCAQMQNNIVNAVAAMNVAYTESGINITSNIVGMALTSYAGTSTSQALSDLRGTTDGQMDEVHALRDQLGADLVAMIHDGDGCGIGYLGSSASTAFTVTNYNCLGGNRTLSHELGHNQGAHHDRVTVGTTSTTTYNYGYRRCNNTSLADYAPSPHFRTIMAYSCTNAGRVGRFSNPNVNYSGVPQGVDPNVDASKGAFNALVLNDSANYVAGFRQTASTQPPLPPDGLSASAQGSDSILVTWTDNSNDESGFVVQTAATNSSNDGDWSDIASLGAGVTSYTHSGLNAETTYWYRARAYNSAGSSAYSNTGSATTDPLPTEVPDLALADNFDRGTVTGTYVATQAPGGSYQTITERSSGGPKRSRKQSYDHSWDFDVFGGAGGVIVSVNARVSGEGANFWYSTDGGSTTTPMFTVNNTSFGADQTFPLPPGTSGAVIIGVSDAEQRNGEAVDSVDVDYLVITSYTIPASPPAAPSGLAVDGTTSNSVSLSFVDNATDEWGFEVWRAGSALGDCTNGSSVGTVGASTSGSGSFTDDTVSPENTYSYWVTAFNGGGNSACSNRVEATTLAAPNIRLDVVSPYKVKGKQKVDLEWTAPGAVNIYRDAVIPGTLVNVTTNSATDAIDAKGGGSYTYVICLVSDTNACSAPVVATF